MHSLTDADMTEPYSRSQQSVQCCAGPLVSARQGEVRRVKFEFPAGELKSDGRSQLRHRLVILTFIYPLKRRDGFLQPFTSVTARWDLLNDTYR